MNSLESVRPRDNVSSTLLIVVQASQSTPLTDPTLRPEDKPLGDPRGILAVFRQDGDYYVKVNMARDYEKAPGFKAHEYLPLVFDVVQFKQTFPSGGHEELMKKLEEKLADLEAELDKDKMECSAADDSWVQRFSDWLQPIFGCLIFGIGDHPASCDPAVERRHHGPNGKLTQSEAYSRTSRQSMIPQHNAIGERTH